MKRYRTLKDGAEWKSWMLDAGERVEAMQKFPLARIEVQIETAIGSGKWTTIWAGKGGQIEGL